MADQDYHLDATWSNLLNSLAGNNAQTLQSLIPSIYGGATPAAQLEAYAADMARKVRASFPTRVAARMVENNSLVLPVAAPGASFYRRFWLPDYHPAGGHLLPAQRRHRGVCAGQNAVERVSQEPAQGRHRSDGPVRRQMDQEPPPPLPGDAQQRISCRPLSTLGFTSARDIAIVPQDKFLAIYGSSFPSLDEASQVHRKARQVNSVVVNLFSSAKLLDTVPTMNVLNQSPTVPSKTPRTPSSSNIRRWPRFLAPRIIASAMIAARS